jgi:peroxiredoxin
MKKQKMFHWQVFCACLALLMLLPIISQAATKMPSFALESVLDGKIIESNSFKGKVLLLTFFATWCPPCAEEIPTLIKLQNELADAGFSVVGISVDQQSSVVVAKFVEKRAVNYPVLMAGPKTTRDFGGVYGIPVAFLVNKSGNVVKKYLGNVQEQQEILEKDIRSLLN